MIWQKGPEGNISDDLPKDIQPETHGGNIYSLAEELGVSVDQISDFSASINPLGVPKSVMATIKNSLQYLCNYPDPDVTELRVEIAGHLGIDSHGIICGNGSTELIYLIVRSLWPEKVLIPAPTFSEYERAVRGLQAVNQAPPKINYFVTWEKEGFDINPDRFIAAMGGDGKDPALKNSVDMVFICNPNNPTGRLLKKEKMLKITNAARRLKCYIVVDEAFIDFCPEESLVKEVGNNPYLIVLRSMTKFYALSGLRIGYCVVPLKLLELVKKYKEPWTVNTLAQEAGITAINDISYKSETFRVIQHEKKVLEDGFELLNISYFPTDANFYLLRIKNAKQVARALREKGILVRECSNFMGLDESHIRVAVKGNRDNMRLLKELSRL